MELSLRELWMSRSLPEDEQLSEIITRAVNGDHAAFEEIVVRHERRILTLAYRLLGNPEDAQDAAQEVFIRTFKYLRRFDRNRPFEPWLVRTTVNVCRRLGRRRHRNLNLFSPADGIDREDTGNNPHTLLRVEEQRKILYQALACLPAKERAAVVLRDIEGMTTAEVAAILGSAEATVRSQISAARLKIRKAIQRMKGVL